MCQDLTAPASWCCVTAMASLPGNGLQHAVEPLSLLGFTELEATVYAFLVQHSPATGYRISRAIGKPIANTYKAIEALQRKGAVLVDETGNRMCRAVPPEDLLDRAERTFRQRHREAKRALSRIPKATPDTGIYALTSPEQVYDRCRKMLAKAREVAVLDLFPEPLSELRPAVLACARRGVRMAVQVYQPEDLPGIDVVQHGQADTVLQKWDGHWLNCVIDGAELVIAFMGRDGETVHQAIWNVLLKLELNRALVQRYMESARSSVFFLDPHVCLKCHYRSTDLLWQCPHCHEWNSFVEERIAPAKEATVEM